MNREDGENVKEDVNTKNVWRLKLSKVITDIATNIVLHCQIFPTKTTREMPSDLTIPRSDDDCSKIHA